MGLFCKYSHEIFFNYQKALPKLIWNNAKQDVMIIRGESIVGSNRQEHSVEEVEFNWGLGWQIEVNKYVTLQSNNAADTMAKKFVWIFLKMV